MQLFVIIACYRYIFPIHSTQDNLTFSQYKEKLWISYKIQIELVLQWV